MGQYANNTTVSTGQSEQEIKRTLMKYGASDTLFAQSQSRAIVGFEITNRQVKIYLPLPNRYDKKFTHHSRGQRTPEAATKEWEQACRSLWRALALVIKAKLEAVECGISTVEREFLADVVLPGGMTIGERLAPQLNEICSGVKPLMLTGTVGDTN